MAEWWIVGGVPLAGEARVASAKNALLPAMAAALLTEECVRLEAAPSLRDVKAMGAILSGLGARVQSVDGALEITAGMPQGECGAELASMLRASVLVLGPLIARQGYARVALPGGCAIGQRPIDLHIKGLQKMGAKVTLEGGFVCAEGRLRGARLCLDLPSVGATENLMMAAALAEGETVIENAAREPEILDLASLLNTMGGQVEGAGGTTLTITGVRELHGARYRVIPDRIEAGTLMCAVAAVGGNVMLRGARADHLGALIYKLREAGLKVNEMRDGLRCRGTARLAADVRTGAYPGFPTDLQAPFMAVSCLSRGTSVIRETVFENRMMHVPEFARMGADIVLDERTVVLRGGKLTGARVTASDLRAGAGLVVAALAARGETQLRGTEHIERGYEALDGKLSGLGAQISRSSHGNLDVFHDMSAQRHA